MAKKKKTEKKPDSIYFYKKGFKASKEGAVQKFMFPTPIGDVDYDMAEQLKMMPALKRYAETIFDHLYRKNDEVIGIKIVGIQFTVMLKA